MGLLPRVEHKLLPADLQQLQEEKRRGSELRLSVAEHRRVHHVRAFQLRPVLDTGDRGDLSLAISSFFSSRNL